MSLVMFANVFRSEEKKNKQLKSFSFFHQENQHHLNSKIRDLNKDHALTPEHFP